MSSDASSVTPVRIGNDAVLETDNFSRQSCRVMLTGQTGRVIRMKNEWSLGEGGLQRANESVGGWVRCRDKEV